MKLLLSLAAIAAITLSSLSAQAAGPIQNATLKRMGLGAMSPLSDTDAMAVRGRGVFVFGGSSVKVNGVTTYGTPYLKFGSHFAFGATSVSSGTAAAGGFSGAVAF